MVNETNVTNPKMNLRKERFEFVLTINDFIVCQRYFKINRLKPTSLRSLELKDTLDYCVEMIKRDLRNKSNLYNWYTAPMVFQNQEEFDAWITHHTLKPLTFVLFRDTESVYTWDGDVLTPFEKRFNISDYMSVESDVPDMQYTLKFEFIDNGRDYQTFEKKHVLYSRIWDSEDYPKFISGNIDLSNYKNKYDMETKPFEAYLTKLLTKDRGDLVSQIIDEICDVCSIEDGKYTTKMKYGKTVYSTNIKNTVNEQNN